MGAVALGEEEAAVIEVAAAPLLHQPLQELSLRIADDDAAVSPSEHVDVVPAVCAPRDCPT